MELCELSQVREQVRDLLTSGVPDGAALLRVHDDLAAAEGLLATPMAEVPEELRPVAGVEDWVRDMIREAQGILEAVPA